MQVISFPARRRIFRYCWLVLISSLAFAPAIFPQSSLWKTYTNMRVARQLVAANGTIWAATSGGLLAFDTDSQSFTNYTNADGLTGNELTTVAIDKSGRIWMGLGDGTINILNPQSGKLDVIIDYRSFTINDIFPKGDTLYIALNIGVGEYRLDKDEPKELYKQLGLTFSPETPANKVYVAHGTLYVGTNEGLATASLDQPNLKAPQSWVNQTTAQGLPTNVVTDIASYAGKVVIATSQGIVIEDPTGWKDVSTNLPDKNVHAIAMRQSLVETTLFAATSFNVYRTTNLVDWVRLDGFPSQPNDLLVDSGVLWGAANDMGLASYQENTGKWQLFEPNCPKINQYTGVALDQNGVLWCVSSVAGFFAFDGQKWYDFADLGSVAKGDYRTVAVDDSGKVWMGSWGSGVTVLDGPLDNPRITVFDTTGGRLSGTINPGNNLGFVVINDLTKDRHGNIWISNLSAYSGRPLVAVTPDNRWVYFPKSAGLKPAELSRLIVDQFDRVWYGTTSDGIGLVDYKKTLFTAQDDDYSQGLDESDGLLSLQITGLSEDQDGTIWIGSNKGLNYWFSPPRASSLFGLISDDIRVIRIDPANNKWIGTSGGVTVIASDNTIMTHYTTDNSAVVSNSLADFAFNPKNGDVYIATTNGLSVLKTPFTATQATFATLKGYPNPFVLDNDGGAFNIVNLVRQAGVKIYTEDGRLVRTYEMGTIPGAQVVWDGKTADGRVVSSGLYIFVAYSENSGMAAGKVLVVRR